MAAFEVHLTVKLRSKDYAIAPLLVTPCQNVQALGRDMLGRLLKRKWQTLTIQAPPRESERSHIGLYSLTPFRVQGFRVLGFQGFRGLGFRFRV